MRCQQVRRELHEAPRPEEPLSPAIQAHLQTCSRCRETHLELVALRRGLHGLKAPELPAGFELALRQRLREAQRPRQAAARRRWMLPIALAASVLLAIGAGTALMLMRIDGTGGSVPASAQHYSLRLSIRTAKDHPEALFDLQLPRGVVLSSAATASLGGGALVQWRSRLQAGRNELELPLVVREPGAVRVAVQVGGRSLATTVHLTARAAASGQPIVVALTFDGEPAEVLQ